MGKMGNKTEKRKIKNLNTDEFNNLFSKGNWEDLECVRESGRFYFITGLLKNEIAKDIGRGILVLLAVAGVVTVAATMPNAVILFKGFRKNYYKKISKENYYKCFNNLKRQGHINYEYTKDGFVKLTITEKGKSVSQKIQFANLKIEKSDKWDKKWRIVTFDIPEKHKSARDSLRNKLIDLGFRKIQDSVFLYPYECFKEIDAIVRIYSIAVYVRYFIAEDFHYSDEFKQYFGLI